MAQLTVKERETVQRALGMIEGVGYGMDSAVTNALIDAVQMINGLLENGKGGESDA